MWKWKKWLGKHGKRWKRSGSAPGNALRTGLRLALLAIVPALTGCADSGGEPVYEAEFVDLDIPEAETYYDGIDVDFSLFGDELYYVTQSSGEIDPETGFPEAIYNAYCLQLGEAGEARSLPIEWESDTLMEYFKIQPDRDGNYLAAYKKGNGIYLEKYDDAGVQLFTCQAAMREEAESGQYINEGIAGMAQDGSGNVYIAVKNDIYLLDAKGENCQTVSLETESNWDAVESIACGLDGNVYCTMNRKMYRIESGRAEAMGRVPSNFGMAPVNETELLVADYDKLNLYRMEEDTLTDVVEWQDCDLDAERLLGFTRLEDGSTAVLFWEDPGVRIALIRETDGRGAPRRETVTLGVVSRNDSLRKAALAYNRQGGPYRIKIKQYWDNMLGSGQTIKEASANLNLDIVSGNCPDIVNLQYGSLGSFASKGVLEDLTRFLEESELEKEDFVDAVLEAYTVDGKLLSLPNTFCIRTVAVRSDLVGGKTAWSLEEMMELAESRLLASATKADVLDFCLKMNLSYFMDWEAGTCSFASEEFGRILEFSNRFPLEEREGEDHDQINDRYNKGKVLLYPVNLVSPDEISYVYEGFGWKDVTFIGYPTMDGSSGHRLDGAGGAYAIFAKSPHKEGAWDFLEALQDSEAEGILTFAEGFPTKKEKLEELLAESMEDPYKVDWQSGETETDSKGKPARRPTKTEAFMMPDGSLYERHYYVPLPEEVEELRRLIGLARPAWQDEEVMNIIREETAAYFHGQKSLETVTGLIDNRVGLYMNER